MPASTAAHDPPPLPMTIDAPAPSAPAPEPQRGLWPVTYRGLQYLCEVVFARSWNPMLVAPLDRNAHARVVFLSMAQGAPVGGVAIPRVAVCVPGYDRQVHREQVDREMHAASGWDAHAAQSGPEAAASVMACRNEEEAAAFRDGAILAADAPLAPGAVFGAGGRREWVQTIAEALLEAAYPALPIDPSGFTHALSATEVPLIFSSLVNGGESPAARQAALAFAPGLGLAASGHPTTLADAGSPILDVIEDGLDGNDGALGWDDLQLALSEAVGLPGNLPLLFTLCFVALPGRRAELELREGHSVTMVDGKSLPGRFLTAYTIADVRWDEALLQAPSRLLYQGGPTWDKALPFAVALGESLGLPASDVSDLGPLLARLGERLKGIAPPDAPAKAPGPPPPEVEARLSRLRDVAGAESLPYFFADCARLYGRASLLKRDLAAVFDAGGVQRSREFSGSP